VGIVEELVKIWPNEVCDTFNDNGYQKMEILERTHINIWGLSPTQSAEGVSYFMLLMDGHLSYRTVTFLKTKSANVTLNNFETYHNEAE